MLNLIWKGKVTYSTRARPAEEAVHDLNEKLTVSLSLKIPERPVLFCQNGALACFSNGLPLHEYQAVDIQRICDQEGEQVATEKGSRYILAYDMGLGKPVTMVVLVCGHRKPAPNSSIIPIPCD
ncbi:hypothetical protein C8J57DRAFT_1613028 [Mycena rebaudengoi]|nr:hypothetical protein C8J57DRAFT_1613028 [Mycena rebaudengoi]